MGKGDVGTFAAGAGAYFGMVYGLIFYPALIIGIQTSSICIDYLGQAVGDGYVWGIIATIVFCCFIVALQALGKWKPIVWIYVITLFPFINLVAWIWHMDESGTHFVSIPFPGLNWIPFF